MCFEVGAMLRRDFISFLAVTLVAGSRVAIAQTPSKVYRVGTVFPSAPLDEKSPLGAVLLKKLEQHGYTLGKNLAFEARGAGGNISGISDNAAALATKRLELIKQAVPKVRRVAMLWNRNDLGMSMRYDASADAARSLGVTVQPFGVREPDDFAGVFEAMDRDPPDAIFMVADSLTTLNRKRVFDYAGAHHIPALYEYDIPNVYDGGLMSYGPDLKESMERAAGLTARILGGARPADLPFEEPTHYKLVINLKTAKATGIELPMNFLALANEVIE
jgi:putative ABC transport system substrate-binding protein